MRRIFSLLAAGFLFSAPIARAEALSLPAYTFDPAKLGAAEDDFHFLRSFVDYFYLLIKENEARLTVIKSLSAAKGWCVGDAHPENFGALLQEDGSSLFTVNDIDDAGPCPMVLDIVRLSVSARLADKDFNGKPILEAYLAGQDAGTCEASPEANALLEKSRQRGAAPDKNKVAGDRLVRGEGAAELPAVQKVEILAALSKAKFPSGKGFALIDAISTAKVGGGSGGLRRFELLFQTNSGLLHVELKQEPAPGIYPVSAGEVPEFPERLTRTLLMERGEGFNHFNAAVKIGAEDFYLRPRFAGNQGVNLNKNNFTFNRGLILHEACLLGTFHGKGAVKNRGWLRAMNLDKVDELEEEIKQIAKAFKVSFENATGK